MFAMLVSGFLNFCQEVGVALCCFAVERVFSPPKQNEVEEMPR